MAKVSEIMKRLTVFICVGIWIMGQSAKSQDATVILDKQGTLGWNSGSVTGGIEVVEFTTNFPVGPWIPTFYDRTTNTTRSLDVGAPAWSEVFYRLRIQMEPPDPTLVLHFPFDNHFSNGLVVDISGYNNHGRRYGRPDYPTNWPATVPGIIGRQSAQFRWYSDGYGAYGRSGDYIGIPNYGNFVNMTQATVAVWAHYFPAPGGTYVADNNATMLHSGFARQGTWKLGREYSSATRLRVYTNSNTDVVALRYPDDAAATGGDTGGWHHYAMTFDAGQIIGYFDGQPFQTNNLPVPFLTTRGYYLGISCWTFNQTPELDLSKDAYPNNGWFDGTMDDMRIYRRTLTPEEIMALYAAAGQ